MEKFLAEYVQGSVNGHTFWGIPSNQIPAHMLAQYGDASKNALHPSNNEWLFWDLDTHTWKNGKNARVTNRDIGMFSYNPRDSRNIYSDVAGQYREELLGRRFA